MIQYLQDGNWQIVFANRSWTLHVLALFREGFFYLSLSRYLSDRFNCYTNILKAQESPYQSTYFNTLILGSFSVKVAKR